MNDSQLLLIDIHPHRDCVNRLRIGKYLVQDKGERTKLCEQMLLRIATSHCYIHRNIRFNRVDEKEETRKLVVRISKINLPYRVIRIFDLDHVIEAVDYKEELLTISLKSFRMTEEHGIFLVLYFLNEVTPQAEKYFVEGWTCLQIAYEVMIPLEGQFDN